jgi:hypothetical protein
MKLYQGYEGISFTDWIVLKMIIKIYGTQKIIEVCKNIDEIGGIENIKTIG